VLPAPAVKLMKEVGRELTIDPETEAKLLAVAKQPMKDVLIVIQDTGMRPEEVFRIRIEHIDWSQRLIFNPNGKPSSPSVCTNQRTNGGPVDGSLRG
jgi:integrase